MDSRPYHSQSFLGTSAQSLPPSESYPQYHNLNLKDASSGPYGVHVDEVGLDSAMFLPSVNSADRADRLRPLGVPRSKAYVSPMDLLSLAIAIGCCALAILAVEHNGIAWHLRRTNQLIISGFLLSVMNICLTRTTPLFCAIVEARFGQSTLQNYDGILRNKILGQGLHHLWRTALLCFMVIPIGLSAAYKTFQNGSSSLAVNATHITGLSPDYGLFSVPGLVHDNYAMYLNSTLQFRVNASRPIADTPSGGPEPALPQYPRPFGANALTLSNNETVMLDLPRTTRVSQLQQYLSVGDSLQLSAHVYGTVAGWRKDIIPSDDPDYEAACSDSNMKMSSDMGSEGWALQILAPDNTGDNSRVWVGLIPNDEINDCSKFAQYARRYNISRKACRAMWTITRAGIQLSAGSCDDGLLDELYQKPFQVNTFFVGSYYNSVLGESLLSFATSRKDSAWKDSYMTTMVAAMMWARLVTTNGVGFVLGETENSPNGQTNWGCCDLTLKDNGILYQLSEDARVIRTTLRRSGWLYLVFAIQPALLAVMTILMLWFHSMPLGDGFGMISILAGVERKDLDVLHGASLSGELREHIRLAILPVHDDHTGGSIRYQIGRDDEMSSNGRLRSKLKYA